MPNVRILNWNIQQFGPTKADTPGMLAALGSVIAATAADVVIITEVSEAAAFANMALLAAAVSASAGLGVGGGELYTTWLVSYRTGGERYGVIFRDMDVVRPVRVVGGPLGDSGAPLMDFDQNQFGTWPNPFPAPAGAPRTRPYLPLIDVFASAPPTRRKRSRFAGGTLANGGYALGRGFRLPCLIMVSVASAMGPPHLIPIMVCHLGAVRGGSNTLARGQIAQYKDTDIAQRFNAGGYIDLDGAPVPIQELVITGDFNVDFLQNVAPGTALQTGNHAALVHLTPTQAGGTSMVPAAQPGRPGPAPMVPIAMPVGGWPDGPVSTNIPDLALRAAATTRGTMLLYPVAPVDGVVPPFAGACFDNFFYGGVQLAGTMQADPMFPGETCRIQDVPGTVVRRPPPATAPNVGPLWSDYIGLPPLPAGVPRLKTQWAIWSPNLNPVAMAAVKDQERLIGARFLSDHLPTFVQANLP